MAKRQLTMLNFVANNHELQHEDKRRKQTVENENDEREKQPKSNENSKKQKQEGESDKKDEKRKIKSEWFSQFTWLKIREDKFYCKYVNRTKKQLYSHLGNKWTSPKRTTSSNMKPPKIMDALKVPELKTNLGKAMVNAYHKWQNGVIALMRTIYVMAKENISTRKIKALTELQVLNGCEDLRPLQRMVGTDPDMPSASSSGSATRVPMAYTHHDSIDDIYDTLSDTILSEIISAVKSASYFSIQIDEGTDCSNKTTLMMYIRFIDVQGQIQSCFLTVKELAGCSSSLIFDSLKLALKEKGLNIAKMVGFASDGASVMTGVKKGVTALAKDANPFILTVHCLAHRLALAFEKAAKQIPYMVKYLEVVDRLGKLCKFPAKFCRLLENSKNINGQLDALKLKQVFFTRWLSFADCVDSLVGCLESLISCLHTTSPDPSHSVTAKGILKNVACYKCIATTYFCADLVDILGLLCKCMQKDKLLYADIKSQINSTITAIQVLESTDGPHFAEFLKKISQEPSSEFPTTTSFNNTHDVSDSDKQRADFQSTRKQLVQKIVSKR